MVCANSTDILIREPDAEYRAKTGENLTSHLLADFRACPLLYYRKREKLISNEDRPAYLLGRATHSLILEGRETYTREYATGGPINPATGKTYGPASQKYRDWAETQDKAILTAEQADLVERLNESIRAHEIASALLACGQAEGVVRTECCGVPCQSRMDFYSPEHGLIDLKTCDNLTWFEADARRYGYAYQVAFYRALLSIHLNDFTIPVHIVAVEKQEPYRCGVWKLTADSLDCAQRENEAAIARLKACEASGIWPTGYEDVRFYDAI